jgi:uncharacterized protein (TIGR02145 family)
LHPSATNDLGCISPQGCNEWCEGDEGVVIEFDCNNECGGSAVLDDCGICDTDATNDCEYESITIGEQLWMAENLKVTHYNNGDEIPTGLDNNTWANTIDGAYAIYDDDPANAAIYGNLYNWYAVDDDRSIAPEGWHIPSDDEYTTLTDYLGGESVSGGKMKEAGTEHWDSPNTGATNESGFTALPGGWRYDNSGGADNIGNYSAMGTNGSYWTTFNSGDGIARRLSTDYDRENTTQDDPTKSSGFQVRCLAD